MDKGNHNDEKFYSAAELVNPATAGCTQTFSISLLSYFDVESLIIDPTTGEVTFKNDDTPKEIAYNIDVQHNDGKNPLTIKGLVIKTDCGFGSTVITPPQNDFQSFNSLVVQFDSSETAKYYRSFESSNTNCPISDVTFSDITFAGFDSQFSATDT